MGNSMCMSDKTLKGYDYEFEKQVSKRLHINFLLSSPIQRDRTQIETTSFIKSTKTRSCSSESQQCEVKTFVTAFESLTTD